jgi:hypothetical protein
VLAHSSTLAAFARRKLIITQSIDEVKVWTLGWL